MSFNRGLTAVFLAVSLAALTLTACARDSVRQSQATAQALVGQPVATLAACLGAPDRSRRSGDDTIYSWIEGADGGIDRRSTDDPTLPTGSSSRSGAAPVFSAARRYCQLDLRVRDQRVIDATFSGESGSVYGRGGPCADLLRGCSSYMNTAPSGAAPSATVPSSGTAPGTVPPSR